MFHVIHDYADVTFMALVARACCETTRHSLSSHLLPVLLIRCLLLWRKRTASADAVTLKDLSVRSFVKTRGEEINNHEIYAPLTHNGAPKDNIYSTSHHVKEHV